MEQYHFQYCQKIIVLSKDLKKVLLCRRKGEADYDGAFSFIGGKMEITDQSILDGLRREKNEEVGEKFRVRLFPTFTVNFLFRKQDGNAMVLPHYLAVHESGEIELNEEYSECRWVDIGKVRELEPKIPTIPTALKEIARLAPIAKPEEFVLM